MIHQGGVAHIHTVGRSATAVNLKSMVNSKYWQLSSHYLMLTVKLVKGKQNFSTIVYNDNKTRVKILTVVTDLPTEYNEHDIPSISSTKLAALYNYTKQHCKTEHDNGIAQQTFTRR